MSQPLSANKPNKPISVLVVMVNYRTPELAIDCLRSLEGEVKSFPGLRAIVVDNASSDGSVEQIQAAIETEGWEDWVSLLPSDYNGGYAYGNNLAIRPALESSHPPSYFLLLNPDGLVRPGAIKGLVDFMEQHPQAGISSGSWEDVEGNLRSSLFRFPSVLSELDAGLRLGLVSKFLSKWSVVRPLTEEECQVDWVPGCGIFARREVFESVGLMDEEYFLYYEDTDFCLQAKRAGWECWYLPQSRMMFIGGQSTGLMNPFGGQPKRRPQYWFEARRRYFVKNHGLLYAALADMAWIAGFALWRLRRVIQRKPDNDPPQLLGDSIRNSVFCQGSSFLKKET